MKPLKGGDASTIACVHRRVVWNVRLRQPAWRLCFFWCRVLAAARPFENTTSATESVFEWSEVANLSHEQSMIISNGVAIVKEVRARGGAPAARNAATVSRNRPRELTRFHPCIGFCVVLYVGKPICNHVWFQKNESTALSSFVSSEELFRTCRLGGVVVHDTPWRSFRRSLADYLRIVLYSNAKAPFAGDVIGVRAVEEAVETRSMLRSRFILHPDDQIKMVMDVLLCFCVMASVVEVPISVGFALAESTELLVFESIITAVFMCDIVRAVGCSCREGVPVGSGPPLHRNEEGGW